MNFTREEAASAREQLCMTISQSVGALLTEDLENKDLIERILDDVGRSNNLNSIVLTPSFRDNSKGTSNELSYQNTKSLSNGSVIAKPVFINHQLSGTIIFTFPDQVGLGWRLHNEMLLPICLIALIFFSHGIYSRYRVSKVAARVHAAFDSMAEGILILDEHERVVLANHAMEHAVGIARDEFVGKDVKNLALFARDKEQLPWEAARTTNSLVNGVMVEHPCKEKTYSVTSTPILNERGHRKGILSTFEDVTALEKKKNELDELVKLLHRSSVEIQKQNKELTQQANYDPLTGCRNRRAFFDLFQSAWMTATRNGGNMSAIMIDIDHFKSINDRFGHAAGDEVIRHLSATLQMPLRESDILCRYGGEEFAIVLPNTDLQQAALVAERLRNEVESRPHGDFAVTASFGVSALSQSPCDPQDLLNQADKCLLVAKRLGRNQVIRFDEIPRELPSDCAPDRVSDKGQASKSNETQLQKESIPYHAVSALLSALAYRDQKTAAHSRRVADHCVAVAEGLLSLNESYTLEMAALLHDIGKIGVPDAILHKPSALTNEEWKIMSTNTRIGSEIIRSAFASTALTELVRGYQVWYNAPAAWDENHTCRLTVGARILAIADAFDAMTTDHGYRQALTQEQAIDELWRNAGTQFDPEFVARFAKILNERLRALPPVTNSSHQVALSIGPQLEGLVAAIESQNLRDINALAGRLKMTARTLEANNIADKAEELEFAIEAGDDFLGALQYASELLELCRSTQCSILSPRTISG